MLKFVVFRTLARWDETQHLIVQQPYMLQAYVGIVSTLLWQWLALAHIIVYLPQTSHIARAEYLISFIITTLLKDASVCVKCLLYMNRCQ